MPNPKVLVTGGAGFIGSHIVDRLVEEGHAVVVVDNLSSGRREHINPKAAFYQVDVRDDALEEVFRRERPQVVDHHAAQMSVNYSLQNPLEDAAINVLGSLKLLEYARKYGVERFVFASTGGALYGEPEYLPCDENHPIRPLSPYGVSKYAVEQYLALYHRLYGLPYVALRYGNVYGPRQNPHGEAGVVAIFTQRMLESREAVIYGTGEQRRDFVYVSDVAEANLLALDKGDCQCLNTATGVDASVNDVFAALKKATGYPRDAVEAPARPGEVFAIRLSHQKAQEALGWRPRVGLTEGLAETVTFFRSQLQHPAP
ncbi:MAG: SDR family oxidoreductase [Dehalococcoidia bacterium]|nr:SDR family oxidoreductase [Dehalococcoidia bacterium]